MSREHDEKKAAPTRPLEPGLYIAASPIGNLGDVTFRVVDALRSADVILCEDTRHSARLCAAYGVSTPRRPYHEHNARAVRPAILRQLAEGARIVLLSDAGTPLIADPGYKLVAEARAAGLPVFALPGPSAAIAALSVCGLPTDRFLFAGFPPPKRTARRAFLEELRDIRATIVIYEAPGRVADTLHDMAEAFGPRAGALARELTKLHETVAIDRLDALAERCAADPPRGECVLLAAPPVVDAASPADIETFLLEALADMSVRDAAEAAAAAFGAPRREVYERALRLKKQKT